MDGGIAGLDSRQEEASQPAEDCRKNLRPWYEFSFFCIQVCVLDDDTSAVSSWSSLLDASMDDTQKDVDTVSSQQLREKISDLEKRMATQKKANENLTRRMNAKE